MGQDLKFADPALSRPASIAAGIKNLAAGRKKKLATGKSAIVEDRDNPELEGIIASDPTEFMRERLTRMMVRELSINDVLYSTTPPDHKAISDSNKRLMDLGEALKALPNQVAGASGRVSLAEAIDAAIQAREEVADQNAEVAARLEAEMLHRSEETFGDQE